MIVFWMALGLLVLIVLGCFVYVMGLVWLAEYMNEQEEQTNLLLLPDFDA